jgi:hypothetical protein
MTDRELLEAAARAAGYPFDEGYFQAAEMPSAWWGWVYIDGSGDPPEGPAWTELWNPLTNDGDALRLAVALKLNVFHAAQSAYALESDDDGRYEMQVRYIDANNDPYAATRRAIVRAAAALGEDK